MTAEERLCACYQHAVLRYLNGQWLKNATLRERLGVERRNAAQISGVKARRQELIRVADPARPRAGYAPFRA